MWPDEHLIFCFVLSRGKKLTANVRKGGTWTAAAKKRPLCVDRMSSKWMDGLSGDGVALPRLGMLTYQSLKNPGSFPAWFLPVHAQMGRFSIPFGRNL